MRPWDKHPPWAHWVFYVVWAVAGTLGPILLLETLIVGAPRDWWIGFSLCLVWLVSLGVDWLLVRWLQQKVDGWSPWEPTRRWLKS